MWIKLFKLISSRILLFIMILLCGCSTNPTFVKVQINSSLPFREVEKIPLRVGLYLDPNLINYSRTPPRWEDRNFVIQMGEALSNGAQNVTNKAFREVVNVYTIDAELLPKGLDALVIPEVDRIYGGYGTERPLGTVIVRIRWRIIDLSGKVIYMNTFGAESKWSIFTTTALNYFDVLSRNYTKAIEEQFIKAYIGITSTNWWELIKKEPN